MAKPILRSEVSLRKGVKLAPDNSLEARRSRARRVPKNRLAKKSRKNKLLIA